MKRPPPPKKSGQGRGPRTLNGEFMDTMHTAYLLFGDGNPKNKLGNRKKLERLVARREVPFRKLGGRNVFVRSELIMWMTRLPGCSLKEAMTNTER